MVIEGQIAEIGVYQATIGSHSRSLEIELQGINKDDDRHPKVRLVEFKLETRVHSNLPTKSGSSLLRSNCPILLG